MVNTPEGLATSFQSTAPRPEDSYSQNPYMTSGLSESVSTSTNTNTAEVTVKTAPYVEVALNTSSTGIIFDANEIRQRIAEIHDEKPQAELVIN
jgi:hypothetical protein